MSDHFGKIPIQPQSPAEPGTPGAMQNKSSRRSSKNTDGRGIRLWLGLCLALLAVYSLGGFFLVPYYLGKVVPSKLYTNTGFTLKSEKITFNPYTLNLRADNCALLYDGEDKKKNFLTLKSVKANLDILSLFRNSLVCNTISLEELIINIVRKDNGSYNFEKLLGEKGRILPSGIIDFSSLPFFFSFNNIKVKKGKINFLDRPTGKTHTMVNIELTLPTWSNIPFHTDTYIQPRFSAIIDGSPVTLTGKTHINSNNTTGAATKLSCKINGLDLSLYADYLPFKLPLIISEGKAKGIIELNFNPTATQNNNLWASFDLQIANAHLFNHNRSLSLTTSTINIAGDIRPLSKSFHITNIAVKDPLIISHGESILKNTTDLLALNSKKPAGLPRNKDVFSLHLEKLTMENGTVKLFTKKGEKTATAIWNSVQLAVKNCSKPLSAPKKDRLESFSFKLSGQNPVSSASFSWHGNIQAKNTISGKLSLKSFAIQEIFDFFIPTKKLSGKGQCNIKGELTLQRTKPTSEKIGVTLANARISLHNFTLYDGITEFLSTPTSVISSFNSKENSVNFGVIAIEDGLLRLPDKNMPAFLKQFTKKNCNFKQLDFSGKTIFLSKNNKPFLTLPRVSLNIKTGEKEQSAIEQHNISLAAHTINNGSIKAVGKMQLTPFSLLLDTKFTDLPSRKIFSIFANSHPLTKINGRLSGGGLLHFPAKEFAGTLSVTNGSYGENIHWQKATATNIHYARNPFKLAINTVDIINSQFPWKLSRNNPTPLQKLSEMLRKNFPDIAHGKNSPAAEPPLKINNIIFHSGKIHFSDKRLIPPWRGKINDLQGTISHIQSSPTQNSSPYQFSGTLGGTDFSIDGNTTFFTKTASGSSTFKLNNCPLKLFEQQLHQHTDLNPDPGLFTIRVDTNLAGAEIKRSGALTINKGRANSTNSDSGLALALLTGIEDTFTINFDYTETASDNNPLFDEMLAHFQTLVVKSTVSPLLLAGEDYKNLIDNEFIEFKPGKSTVTDNGLKNLNSYAALLKTHPHIGLEISGAIDKSKDFPAMLEELNAKEYNRVDTENKKRLALWREKQKEYEQRLKERENVIDSDGKIVEADIPAEILSKFVALQPAPVKITKKMSAELARQRAEVVQHFFSRQPGLDPNRILINKKSSPKQIEQRQIHGVNIILRAFKKDSGKGD